MTAIKEKSPVLAGAEDHINKNSIDKVYHNRIVTPSQHLEYLHRKSHPAGFVHIEDVQEDGKRDFYQARVENLDGWTTAEMVKGKADVFAAINPLYKPFRKNENVSDTNWVWVDLDRPEGVDDLYWATNTVMELQRKEWEGLPEPTAILYSGTGAWLLWRIGKVSSRHQNNVNKWRAVLGAFINRLKPYGADAASKDIARIFRLAGTYNSKSGQMVSLHKVSDQEYDITEMHRKYLGASKASKGALIATKPPRSKEDTSGDPGRAWGSPKSIQSLHVGRVEDIENLVKMRKGQMSGCRNKALFIAAAIVFQIVEHEQAVRKVQEINDTFTDPLSSGEVGGILVSVGRYTEGLKFTNTTLVDWLGITADEQAGMKTVIGTTEKRQRKTARKRRERRAKGVKSRAEYEAQRIVEKMDRLAVVREAIRENPSASSAEIARSTGIPPSTVRRLWKSLK